MLSTSLKSRGIGTILSGIAASTTARFRGVCLMPDLVRLLENFFRAIVRLNLSRRAAVHLRLFAIHVPLFLFLNVLPCHICCYEQEANHSPPHKPHCESRKPDFTSHL